VLGAASVGVALLFLMTCYTLPSTPASYGVFGYCQSRVAFLLLP